MNLSSPAKVLSAALLFIAGGCSVLPERMPPSALHDLGPVGAKEARLPVNPVSVAAPEWLASDRIYYRLSYADPTQVLFYNQDRWLAPPAELLMQYVKLDVKKGGELKITLLNFEQIFDQPSSARVFVRVRVSLLSAQRGEAAHEQEFVFTHPCTHSDAKGAVAAYSALVSMIQQVIQGWLDPL